MKERMRRILCCMGTAGVMTVMMAVPAMAADVTEDDQNIEVVQEAEQTVDEADVQDESEVQEETEVQEEAQAEDAQDSSWSDKVAANVLTYANIREGADVSSQCIGRLPSGAVATVVGNDEGWLQVTSGEVNGYIREDLVVSGDEARNLYEVMYGAGDISAEAVTVDAEAEAAAAEAAAQASQVSAEAVQPEQGQAAEETEADSSQAAAQEVSVSTSDLDLMAAIIECEAGGESYEGKVGVGAVIMNRIRSGEFPNTLSEVIYQSGQFEPTWTGKLSNVLSRGASEACYAAAQDVFAGANTIGDRLFFHAGGGSGLTIGNQTFY
ncbi:MULTISPECIES: cell wall hydrolase [Blautia]|uniref:cell wall hydrolase n=1 Tax=Blautia TaxID=572511 RepID=UPI00164CE588|nr:MULTISPECIES: cell wall hydrolase [Blautia]